MAGRSWRKPPAKRNLSGHQIGSKTKKVKACPNCWHIKLPSEFDCQMCGDTGKVITFDSETEHKRGRELKNMEKFGLITDLRSQPKYELRAVGGRKVGECWADFEYRDKRSDRLVIEDVKPSLKGDILLTELSEWKHKHFDAQYHPLKMEYYT